MTPHRSWCYWSVADAAEVPQIEATIRSARAAGVQEPFHVWSPVATAGAIHHPCLELERSGGIYKLVFLQRAVAELDFDAYVWLDPSHWFVRPPGDVTRLLRGSPLHAPLEAALDQGPPRVATGGLREEELADRMRLHGVRSKTIFAASGGFFVVRRPAVQRVYELAREFWKVCFAEGIRLSYEPTLAYAMQMLCGNPYAHQLERDLDLWRCDHEGHWREQTPDGKPWLGTDCLARRRSTANPALIQFQPPRS